MDGKLPSAESSKSRTITQVLYPDDTFLFEFDTETPVYIEKMNWGEFRVLLGQEMFVMRIHIPDVITNTIKYRSE